MIPLKNKKNIKTSRGNSISLSTSKMSKTSSDLWTAVLEASSLNPSDDFFNPKMSDLPNPFEMVDMRKSVDRIVSAIEKSEHIHIFGDFDCDGVSATAILYEAISSLGIKVTTSIADRARDGHGIIPNNVSKAISSGSTLGISVDVGTSCFEACSLASDSNYDLIVTDHHSPEEELPQSYAVLNPARKDCGFSERELCGTGVVFFMLKAVWQELAEKGYEPDFDLDSLLDRVAIATVADMMDLKGSNRVLVALGLRIINESPSVGVSALIDVCPSLTDGSIKSQDIGFHLAPRINAAGRMSAIGEALALLTADNYEDAAITAESIDSYNEDRKRLEGDNFILALEKIKGSDSLFAYDEGFSAGVVGLVAGRISRSNESPSGIGFVNESGNITLSMRATKGYNIYQLLSENAHLVEGYGGHSGAGGCEVKKENWLAFVKGVEAGIKKQKSNAGESFVSDVVSSVRISAINERTAQLFNKMEPTGKGNPQPRILLKDAMIVNRRDMRGNSVKVKLTDGRDYVDALMFGMNAHEDSDIQVGQRISVIATLSEVKWRGDTNVHLVIDEILA